MFSLDRSAPYRVVVIFTAFIVLGVTYICVTPGPPNWKGIAFFWVLLAVCSLSEIKVANGWVNVDLAIVLPLYLFFGGLVGSTIYLTGAFTGSIMIRRHPFLRGLFNGAQFALSGFIASLAYSLVTGDPMIAVGYGLSSKPIGVAAFIIVFLIINHTLVNINVAIKRDDRRILRNLIKYGVETLKWDLSIMVLTTPLGVLLSWLYSTQGVFGAAVVMVPLLFVGYIFRLQINLSTANRELTILYDVAQSIGSVLELEKLFELIVESIERVTKFDMCALYLWDQVDKQLTLAMIKHPTPHVFEGGVHYKLGQGIIGAVALSRTPELVADAEADPRVLNHSLDNHQSRSLLVVPLIVDDDLVGEIVVGRMQPRAFTEDHLRLLTILCSQAAVAVENAILYRKTEELATIDPMTGLPNYRYFYSRMSEDFERAAATDRPVSLIYLDLDNFKRLNDTYGHQAGDAVLREFAGILKRTVRDDDVPVRYAGDEFVVLLADTDVTRAAFVAERIRQAVELHCFKDEATDAEFRLTVSAGVASYPDHASTPAELIYRADQAMYNGKRQGTNRVTIAGELAPESWKASRGQELSVDG